MPPESVVVGRNGSFVTNPDPETTITAGTVLIAIGAEAGLAALSSLVSPST